MVREHKRITKDKVLSVSGTTKEMNEYKEYLPVHVKKEISNETKQNTLLFKKQRTKVRQGPILSSRYIPKQLKEELEILGVNLSVSREAPYVGKVTINRDEINNQVLWEHGIVPNRGKGARLELSGYDLMHLLENKVLDDTSYNKKVYDMYKDYMMSQDKDFTERYFTYRELKEAGYVVMSGIDYGYDFVIYEEPTKEMVELIEELPTTRVGTDEGRPSDRISSWSSLYAIGMVDVVTGSSPPDIKEIIKGQHTAKKNDMRYYLADVDGYHDEEGHLLLPMEDATTLFELRRNKMNKSTADGRNAEVLRDRYETE